MVLTRALVHWFRQSRQPSLSSSSLEPSSDASADSHESRLYTQSPAFRPSFPGILSSLLQSQTAGSHSSVTDHAVTSSSNSPAVNDVVTRPSPPTVSPNTSFTPAQLATLLSYLPLMPPSHHAVPDAGPAAATSSDESIYGTDPPVQSSGVDAAAADWQMHAAERRRAGPSAILRPLPTFASLTRSVCLFHSDFIIHSECVI